MYCHNCGNRIADDAKFCDACGTQTDTEQQNILARQEKNRLENPPAYLDVKTALIITLALFIVLPGACLFSDAPLAIGFVTALLMSALFLMMGIRNQIKHKKQEKQKK